MELAWDLNLAIRMFSVKCPRERALLMGLQRAQEARWLGFDPRCVGWSLCRTQDFINGQVLRFVRGPAGELARPDSINRPQHQIVLTVGFDHSLIREFRKRVRHSSRG